jgi:predicted nucleic acid-binding protein
MALTAWCPMLSDPDDEPVFETAINGQVDVLVTFNAVPIFRCPPP